MDKRLSYIAENLRIVKERIGEAAEKSGRTASSVELVAVTKTVEPERIQAAYELGLRNFGENRVQELMGKLPLFEDVGWHMIGHLQTNKVKQIAGKVSLVQSVDRMDAALVLAKEAGKLGIEIPVLVEVNIADELSKFGVKPEKALEFVKEITQIGNISVRGLMCVAPFVDNSEKNRLFFRKMFELFIDIREKINNNVLMDVLSMGMTNDFAVAVSEGSTMVRLGSGIFGARL